MRLMRRHILFDLETLGRGPRSAILSIGGVSWKMEGAGPVEWGAEFQVRVAVPEQLAAGFEMEWETVAWWMAKASQEAREAAWLPLRGRMLWRPALSDFWAWAVGADAVWCQGSTFDVPMMETHLRHHGIAVPWEYYQVRDSRTLIQEVWGDGSRGGSHSAIEDAQFRATQVVHRLEWIAQMQVESPTWKGVAA
jgi:inhibitor of KinA sporulation pathway (predicted exonuclease)